MGVNSAPYAAWQLGHYRVISTTALPISKQLLRQNSSRSFRK